MHVVGERFARLESFIDLDLILPSKISRPFCSAEMKIWPRPRHEVVMLNGDTESRVYDNEFKFW